MLLRPLAAALAALFILPATAAELTAPATAIKAVTVFPDRAQVTRTLTIDLPPGANTLLVEQLPASLWVESLRVAGSGQNPIKISAVDMRRVFQAEANNAQQRQLQAKLIELQDQQAGLDAQSAALDSQSAFIAALVASPSKEHQGDASLKPEQWAQAVAAIGQGMRDVGAAQVALNQQKRQLADQIAIVEQELDQIRNDQRSSHTAAIHLDGKGGPTTLSLTYQLPGARWAPVYDANLDTNKKELAVTTAAYVQQATGEDWNGIALTLATARPSAGTSAPELSPWWIDFEVIDDRRYAAPVVSSADMAMEREERDSGLMKARRKAAETAMAEQAASFDIAQLQVADFTAEYQVAGKVNVAANSSRQRFVLAEQKWPVSLSLRAVPRLDPHAYLYATLNYDGSAPLLPGEWRLSRNGAYIGSRNDELLRPGSERKLAFGVDDAVTLSYDQLGDEKGESGLISKDTTIERRYRITAVSGHSDSVPLTIIDQLPVPQNEQIRVELLKESKAPSQRDLDDQKGVMAWELPLKPKEKATVDFGYKVSYPGQGRISGF